MDSDLCAKREESKLRHSTFNTLVILPGAMTLMVFTAGCSSSGGTGTDGGTSSSSIRVGVQAIPEDYVWQAQDWGKSYGLEYKNSVSPSATREFQQLLSGQVDVIDSGSGPALSAISKDSSKLKIIALRHSGGQRNEIMVPTNSKVKSIEDLRAKKIAVPAGSGAAIAFSLYLKSKGMTSHDFTFVNMEPSSEAQALKQGLVDAAIAWEPTPSLVVTSGTARVIADFGSVSTDPAFIITTTKFAKAHRQTLVKFLAATNKMDKFIQNNPEKAAEMAAKVANKGGANASSAAFKRAFGRINTSPDITAKNLHDLNPVEEYMINAGKLPGKVDLSNVVVRSYLKSAKSLGRS